MRRILVRRCGWAAALACFAGCLWNPGYEEEEVCRLPLTNELEVKVVDARTGAVILNANVTARNITSRVYNKAFSLHPPQTDSLGETGAVYWTNVRVAGVYEITVEAPGYASQMMQTRPFVEACGDDYQLLTASLEPVQ